MKKFTALYIFIDANRAPGSAGIQAEALSNWCVENGVTDYRYFADHQNVTTNEGKDMKVRAALDRMMAKVKKQKVSQVLCFELDRLGDRPSERRLVLQTCRNLSTPVVSLAGPPQLEDVMKEIDRWVFGIDDSPPLLMEQLTPEKAETALEVAPLKDIKEPPKKRGRKMTRNVTLINRLLDEGQSLSKIAKAAGCSRATVQLQKKIWTATNQQIETADELPLQVPDRLPDDHFGNVSTSSESQLTQGDFAHA